jgi:hypothetical protein
MTTQKTKKKLFVGGLSQKTTEGKPLFPFSVCLEAFNSPIGFCGTIALLLDQTVTTVEILVGNN